PPPVWGGCPCLHPIPAGRFTTSVEEPDARKAKSRIALGVSARCALGSSACALRSIPPERATLPPSEHVRRRHTRRNSHVKGVPILDAPRPSLAAALLALRCRIMLRGHERSHPHPLGHRARRSERRRPAPAAGL